MRQSLGAQTSIMGKLYKSQFFCVDSTVSPPDDSQVEEAPESEDQGGCVVKNLCCAQVRKYCGITTKPDKLQTSMLKIKYDILVSSMTFLDE